ncbi:hypothetical protein Rta_16310 [Ramlibacter tataouinensis TTB310]|uniref:AB hydrolase-1 domain-containing protein n=1 Tax=Ramlibacter tataouinensis (strain ATCC BAA-407 / DSM 14655 / LMG 21543 / TTB310) TaxID=365046 RepID=F5Y5M7_RAMTT|nr:hypothetical protein Rta_16310 [Ramlibacter tataouinensis TTB310]
MHSGSGSPTYVLMNGAGVTLEGWRPLYPGIERLGTVFAWNRQGLGRSARPRSRQTGALVVASLRELLAYAGLAPPYVLVGHSLGGLHANLFARLHPAEVAGVALIEATHPDDCGRLREHEGRLAGVLARLLAVPAAWLRPNLHAELACALDTARQVEAAGPFPPVPLVVVSGGQTPPRWLMSPEALELKQARQRALAALSPLGEQVIAQASGHFPQRTQPELVLDVLRRLADSVTSARGAAV